MPSKLVRYRGLFQALDAAKPAGSFYVRSARSLADRLTARLELQPQSYIAVLGGIGSGKTSEMLAACDRLREDRSWFAIYIDIARRHDLSEFVPGTILTAVGLTIAEQLPKEQPPDVRHAKQRFRAWALGHAEYQEPPDYEDDGTLWVPGLLKPPDRPFYGDVAFMLDRLRPLVDTAAKGASNRVFFLDSLDRMVNVDHFATLSQEDLRALGELGGVVTSAPLRLLFGHNRPLLDRFAEFYHQAAIDPDGADGLAFLTKVLRTRADETILTDEAARGLAKSSGGVLRDLVALARSAAEQAYLGGRARIEKADVEAAAEAFGRKQLLGLTQPEIERLEKLARGEGFLPISDLDIGLLMTRRVLEYQNGHTRYALHPTVRRLLVAAKSPTR